MSKLAPETVNHIDHVPDRLDMSGAISVLARLLGASAWSMALAVIGLWILMDDSLPGFLGNLGKLEQILIGIGMLCGGQLVFLHFVAERVFSRTPRVLSMRVHWVLIGMGALCFVLVVAGRLMDGGLA